MVFKATFNKISVLMVKETGVPGENHRPATSQLQTLSHNVVSSTPRLKIQCINTSTELCCIYFIQSLLYFKLIYRMSIDSGKTT
jgi:hypothetical protein